MPIDYENEDIKINEIELGTVAALAQQQVDSETRLAELEAKLKKEKAHLRKISEQDLPDAMRALGGGVGLTKFALGDGTQIDVTKEVAASIAKKNRPKAYDWLRENNHGSIIKHELKFNFGKDEEEHLKEFIELVDSSSTEFTCKETESVHAGTLKAFIKQCDTEGEELPEDLLGIYRYSKSKVTMP